MTFSPDSDAISPLETALDEYESALVNWHESTSPSTEETVNILTARD